MSERNSINLTIITPPRIDLLLSRICDSFASAGISTPQFDAETILATVVGIPRLHLSLDRYRILTPPEQELLASMCQRRLRREPLQYILGTVSFFGYELTVTPDVLIPRPETEYLVDLILRRRPESRLHILDIGTGTGAIAIALKAERPSFHLTACDLSPSALQVARLNAERHQADIRFMESDLLTNIQGAFDLIVSNPPYISDDEFLTLEPEVREHEPVLALIADENGLQAYRRILETACSHLLPRGEIYLEIGCTQAESISFLAQKNGFTIMETIQDLHGLDRYLIIRM